MTSLSMAPDTTTESLEWGRKCTPKMLLRWPGGKGEGVCKRCEKVLSMIYPKE